MATERNDWTAAENEATVSSYFSMLKKELAGATYVKAHENERLRTRLNGRTRTAVEYKHQNISAVLLELGWIYIQGYKPMRNVQNELRYEVERQLRLDSALELATVAAAQVERQLEVGTPLDLAFTDPPAVVIGTAEWTPRAVGIKRDYVYQDVRNRKLGLAGELAVVEFEKRRLLRLGETKLASRVEHVSQSLGDGLGYDVRSFEASGSEKFIEVKTTLHSAETPFFLSSNELSASDFYASQFHLFRLFKFNQRAGYYQLTGALAQSCELRPVNYVAVPRTDLK